ncbi:hypothetical protein ACPZJV_18415 [Bacillus velezensis]|uniref:hypothetical protein n=1 Tax=Bacillus TaxID=1386 RepID=UPI0002A118A2|nr:MULTISPECIES: hypothetical protein [Bacillus amyloliquefaciens group]AFZ89926.1 hypothetical protein B938_04490 [Bacillus velezensis AS43.3]AXY37065.1 hypothetical protein D3C60_04655 [Bacillus velezensis]EYB34800.1 hypothetical protein AW26_0118725 [Bacillus amyloliquefaciens EBL11]KOC21397.1 hypothetical protein AC810_16555 [Bacillus velezensis]KOC22876.1 hypothetical protein AC811_15840 [Bacillus velezensis]
MFRKKSGISPTALLIGSSILIAALSPEIRRKISGMVSGRMQHKDGTHSMQPADLIQQAFGGESGGQQHTDKARHSQTGSTQPAELIKQAFGGESGGQQHTDKARHSQTGSLQPAELIKQAFGGESSGQQHEQTSRNHSGSSHTDGQADRSRSKETSPKPHYTEPIHFEESAVNVLNDSTVMNMLEEIEPGNH